jgi:hypothetical protein
MEEFYTMIKHQIKYTVFDRENTSKTAYIIIIEYSQISECVY